MTVTSISTKSFTSTAGLHCIRAFTIIDVAAAAYSSSPLDVELLLMPMCPDPVLFSTQLIIPRALMMIGSASLDILSSDIGIDLSGSSKDLVLDNSMVEYSNIDSIQITAGIAPKTMLINVTDVSRGSTVFIPAHAYTDGAGHPGAENKTLVLPPIPTVTTRTGKTARAIASVSVAATTTSAILSGAAGGASGPGIGRSIANMQFFAWTTGLAVPYLPDSYKDLVNALRWSTIIPHQDSDNIAIASESAVVSGAKEDSGAGAVENEEADVADQDAVQPIVAVEDVHRTLTVVTIVFICLCAVHAGMPCSVHEQC